MAGRGPGEGHPVVAGGVHPQVGRGLGRMAAHPLYLDLGPRARLAVARPPAVVGADPQLVGHARLDDGDAEAHGGAFVPEVAVVVAFGQEGQVGLYPAELVVVGRGVGRAPGEIQDADLVAAHRQLAYLAAFDGPLAVDVGRLRAGAVAVDAERGHRVGV